MAGTLCVPSILVADDAGNAFFEKKVRPLLVEHCLDCHTGEEPESGLSMDSLSGLLRGGLRGPAIVRGKPEESLLISALRHGEILKMPPKEKLPTPVIAEVASWIQRGAPWPNAEPVTIATDDTNGREIAFTAEQRSFWSFQPPRQPTPPVVRNQDWIRSPIDAFLLRKLEDSGFLPAKRADKRTLIRRATFDLTGLPPTAAEVAAFLADDSPTAFARLIDRLLHSPRYGERWGRHWLDVARYADSNGLDENLAFANAFHYRDYVLAAFNKDKPFDRFVQEQIAGDLLTATDVASSPEPTTYPADWDAPYEGQVATGFLALGAKMLAEDDPVKMQMDIIDEQVDTLGRAFMGLTFGCARCHDHKFDPIPTADYYSLAGIFKSTTTMENFQVVARWQEKPLATPAALAAREAHQQQLAACQAAIDKLRQAANDSLLATARQHVGDYLLGAAELQRLDNLIANATVHGDLPDLASVAGAILIEAEEFDRGNVLRDRTNWGQGIGVLVNAGETPNFAEYDIEVPAAGLYQFEIRVAAAAARPTQLIINGRLAKPDVAGQVTGSWYPDGQRWFVEGFFYLRAGQNVLRLEQPQFFPHIDKLLIVPAPPDTAASDPAQVLAALAEARPSGVLLVEAENATRGNLIAVADGYGAGIGILGGHGGFNQGEIEIEIPAAGTYHLAARYAAAEARPTKLLVNGRGLDSQALGQTTGTWFPDSQRWFLEGRVDLPAGKCVVRLEREGPIPHIDKLMFVESSCLGSQQPAFAPLGDYAPHPEFVRQWAAYLHEIRDDPDSPFAAWLAALDDPATARQRAAEFNARAAAAMAETVAASDDLFRAVLFDPQGPFQLPETVEVYYDKVDQQRLAALRKEQQELAKSLPQFPAAMAVSDGSAEDIRIHIRGSHLTQGRQVPRRLPQILAGGDSPEFGPDGSGRAELARWLASSAHPLTARVIVNRIWLWHFGEGLVRTPDNFGKLGLRPTHPQLLDWLAVQFVESGWSIKELHRTLMLSSAYQMSTTWNEAAAEVDPENKLWWRFNRRRLEAESIRDSILSVAGQLDHAMGGSMLPTENRKYVTSTANVDPVAYQTTRRSVYLPVVRSALYEVFQAFDFAEPSVSSGQRQSTTVAPQALFMMNSELVADATRAMAERLLKMQSVDDAARVNAAYRDAYGRSANDAELQRALQFVQAYTDELRAREVAPDESRVKAWQSLCRAILAANEFIFVE